MPIRILCPSCKKELFYVFKYPRELNRFYKYYKLRKCPFCGAQLPDLSQMKLVITPDKHHGRLRRKPWLPPWRKA